MNFQWMKEQKIKSVFILVIIVAFFPLLFSQISPSHIWFPAPFKVIDPDDARFDSTQFKFSDYRTADHVDTVLRKIFPAGTSRENLEEILVKAMGLKASNSIQSDSKGKDLYSVYYIKLAKTGRVESHYVWAVFEPDHRLHKIVGYRYTVKIKHVGEPSYLRSEINEIKGIETEIVKVKLD